MPELPEVETIRRGLRSVILKKPIQHLLVRKAKVVRGKVATIKKKIIGHTITDIRRRGKLLIFCLDNGLYLLIHLKMTGQLIYRSGNQLVVGGHNWPQVGTLPNKYTHVEFQFSDGVLYFNDLRQFGYVHLVDEDGLQKALKSYGPEIIEPVLSEKKFIERIRGRKISIKAALLNQTVVAGIGNIYADEICFAAGVRPSRSVASLNPSELTAIYTASKQILRRAIRYRGTTFSDYHDADGKHGRFTQFLKVYGRGGKECLTCGTMLKKVSVAGRGTVYCTNCQA